MLHFKEKIPRFGRLCENTVHGSTRLTTNGVVSLEIEYLSVRPEHRRRAPREFSHSLSFEMTPFKSHTRVFVISNEVRNLSSILLPRPLWPKHGPKFFST